jgi:hypothetical protein
MSVLTIRCELVVEAHGEVADEEAADVRDFQATRRADYQFCQWAKCGANYFPWLFPPTSTLPLARKICP